MEKSEQKCPECGAYIHEFNNVYACFECKTFLTNCVLCGKLIKPEIGWGSIRDAYDRKFFEYICKDCYKGIEDGD